MPLTASFKGYNDILRPNFSNFDKEIDSDFLIDCFNENSSVLGNQRLSKDSVDYWTKDRSIIMLRKINNRYNYGYISYLVIDTKHQAKGYGYGLMQHVINKVQSLGCKDISLCVVDGNDKAIGLYKKLGFKEISKGEFKLQLAPAR